MEVIALTSVDSTSTHAASLLAGGKKPPFIVWAREQVGGRGQRGRQWLSPPGNLYLTLALPPPDCALAEAGLLSMKAGVVVARLLQTYCGLRLTLKWPNDLLFAGRKLGGLLVESATNGQRAGDLLIGIGLNLNTAPALGADGAALQYQSIALADLLGRPVVVDEFVQHLQDAFPEAWAAQPLAEVPTAAADFMIGVGQRWVRLAPADAAAVHSVADTAWRVADPARGADPTSIAETAWRGDGTASDTRPADPAAAPASGSLTAAHGTGLDSDGALLLRPIGSAASLRFLSADHGWRWLYQTSTPAPLAVADVGNTSIKIALFSEATAARPSWVRTLAHTEADATLLDALHALRQRTPGAAWPLFILSVRPPAAERLESLAALADLTASRLAKRPVRRHGAHYSLAALGSDRLAAIEGWLADLTPAQRAAPRAAGIVVVAGTATTIDAVATSGEHLGGLILPGLGLALSSLHQAASLLPALDPVVEMTSELASACLGTETHTAMLRAAVQMTTGAVENVRRHLTGERGLQVAAAAVVLSGGWGELLAPLVGGSCDVDLVLKGARVMALGGTC